MRFLNLFLIPLLFFASSCEEKTNTVKIGFIGPLTGGLSANGLGGRNSAQLAVDQFNSSNSSKYTYELVPLDDECKPNIGIQVATKIATNKNIIGAVTHY
jgi:branched-chain amino acid transport system substrate-binding protein